MTYTTLISIAAFSFLTGCAGPALYSIRNDSGQALTYSSTSEGWNPDERGKVIQSGSEVKVLFSPDFILVDSHAKKRSYQIHYSIDLADYFVPNWDASDSLHILVSDDHSVWLRKKGGLVPLEDQPSRFGFPAKPDILDSEAGTVER